MKYQNMKHFKANRLTFYIVPILLSVFGVSLVLFSYGINPYSFFYGLLFFIFLFFIQLPNTEIVDMAIDYDANEIVLLKNRFLLKSIQIRISLKDAVYTYDNRRIRKFNKTKVLIFYKNKRQLARVFGNIVGFKLLDEFVLEIEKNRNI